MYNDHILGIFGTELIVTIGSWSLFLRHKHALNNPVPLHLPHITFGAQPSAPDLKAAFLFGFREILMSEESRKCIRALIPG